MGPPIMTFFIIKATSHLDYDKGWREAVAKQLPLEWAVFGNAGDDALANHRAEELAYSDCHADQMPQLGELSYNNILRRIASIN